MSEWGKEYKKYTKKQRDAFFAILEGRKSQRVYNREPITQSELVKTLEMIDKAPSSCGRQGIVYEIHNDRDSKDLLGGLLVGGVGWINRADTIILLFADMLAYKNPAERSNMPYLDAGVIIQQVYLVAEAFNIGCCYVNPNIREQNKDFFNDRFNKKEHLFCGALILGKYDKKAI